MGPNWTRTCAAVGMAMVMGVGGVCSPARAQVGDAGASPVMPPAATQPVGEGASPVAEAGPGGGEKLPDGRVLLNFVNAPLDAVLAFMAETAGLVVLSEVKVEGRVNVLSRQPVTVDEAITVLASVLKEKGYAAIRTGKTLKIMPLDAAKRASIPVRTGANPLLVADSDEVITQVIPVRYADAAQLKRDLAPLIPGYADLSSNVSTNTLILTDTSVNVRRILEIVRALDTAVSAVTQVKVFALKYANAGNAARLLTEIFQQETASSQQQRGGIPAFMRMGRFGPGMAPPGAGAENTPEGSRPQTKVTAAADDRTNTVVVSAPADTMPVIEAVLKDLDANPAQDQAVFIYYMRNAQATNVEAVVNSLFGTSGSSGRSSTSGTSQRQGATGATNRTGTGRSGTTGGGLNLSQIGSGAFGGTRTNGATNTRSTAMPRLSSNASQTAADLAGQVYAVADADTNSLLVMTGSANFERVKMILSELDRPVPQVLIKVLIAEVTHDNDRDLGVEFSAINIKTGGDTTVFSDFGLGTASGGLVTKLVNADYTVTMRALEKVGKLDVLSRPYILTADNQQASIIVGQEVPIVSNSRITDTGQTINSLIYKDVGIILNVTPHVNPDGLVIMDVAPEISALTGDTVAISDTASQPVIAKRAAQTRVAINDGQTIVIGGLMEDRKTQTVRKVPLLGDIPLLGLAFQRNEDKKSKTELLIFLTPQVAQVPEKLNAMSERERGRTTIVPEAVAPGVFQEHMDGMKHTPAATQPAEAAKVREPARTVPMNPLGASE